MLKSVCWASYVNKLISKDSLTTNAIAGNAYDGQKNALQDSDVNREWLYKQESQDKLNLGWISSGLKPWVNLNLIEIYDLDKGNNYATPRLDTAVPDGVATLLPLIIWQQRARHRNACKLQQWCRYIDWFISGPQKLFARAPWTDESDFESGIIGANIYQCAINHGSSEYGCDSTYSSNIDLNASPDQQIMQSFGYIFNNTQIAH